MRVCVCVRLTVLLVADQSLQSNGCLHFDRHLLIIDEVLFDEFHCVPQDQLIVELQRAEAVQNPTGLDMGQSSTTPN